jgi:hypothetical protein
MTTRITERQPIFDFMISGDDQFYINTHGVSITEPNKSFTKLSDGVFNVLNKNTIPIYFNSITVTSVRLRNENVYPRTNTTIILKNVEIIDNVVFNNYEITFRGQAIGKFTLSRPINYDDNSNTKINPFQAVSFSATYTVLNLNNINIHYYGNSRLNPTKNSGIIDITANLRFFINNELTVMRESEMTFSIKVINTKFVPEILIPITPII